MSKERELLQRILDTDPKFLGGRFIAEIQELLAQPEYKADRRSDPISKLRNLRDIQGRKGNYDVDEYMRGLYNGLELSLSIFEDRGPDYKEPIAQPEQPEQEPIAYVADPSVGFDVSRSAQGMPLIWLGKLEYGDKLYRERTRFPTIVPLYEREGLTPREALTEYKRGYARAELDLKREPLSGEQIEAAREGNTITVHAFARAIEKAHGIGGGE